MRSGSVLVLGSWSEVMQAETDGYEAGQRMTGSTNKIPSCRQSGH